MIFKLRRASTMAREPDETVEISTLGDLRQLQEREGDRLIVDFTENVHSNDVPTIVVYDDYLE